MPKIVEVGFFNPRNPEEQYMVKERKVLEETLNELGVSCKHSPSKWPRDEYVFSNGTKLQSSEHGFYADGGYVLHNNNLTFVCNKVSETWNGEQTETIAERTEKLRNLYHNNIYMLPSPDPDMDDAICPHIDLMVLPISEKRIVFVDEIYLKRHQSYLTKTMGENKLRIIPVGDTRNQRYWPCNSLLISDKDNNRNQTVCITAAPENSSFFKTLKEYNILPVRIPFSNNCKEGGSINCATNVYEK
ncbi:MAG: hypothetical protein ACMXYK_00365 [Candidatus Woesearchaeota archaeon]